MERSLEGPQLEAHVFQRYYKSIKVLQLFFLMCQELLISLINFLYLVEQNPQNSLWLAVLYHTVLFKKILIFFYFGGPKLNS